MSKLIPHWKPTWASLLVKEWELRMEPSWRISVHSCCNSVNSLLIICWKVLLVYPHQALSRFPHTQPSSGAVYGWACTTGNPLSLFWSPNQRQTEPDLCVVLRGTDLGTSHQCQPVLYPAAQQMGLSQTLQHGIQAWAGWAVRALLSLNCHQGFSIGGWPSVVTCPLTAVLRPLESSAKLPWIDDLQT